MGLFKRDQNTMFSEDVVFNKLTKREILLLAMSLPALLTTTPWSWGKEMWKTPKMPKILMFLPSFTSLSQ